MNILSIYMGTCCEMIGKNQALRFHNDVYPCAVYYHFFTRLTLSHRTAFGFNPDNIQLRCCQLDTRH